ncbi:FHA domain-containing protein [Pantanalinema sp. GBBB05]|uniref:FHA domain-containing protein n=1 Tax=Pantanalinema sp. GBBB05 TaxID=2604139 RepID=UPI001D33C76F|nr:FHA domain-containing protein [Pantanalinema sp. GBBB05]
MNSDSSSTEFHRQLAGELTLASAPQTPDAPDQASSIVSPLTFQSGDSDSEDIAFTKAPTLLIDLPPEKSEGDSYSAVVESSFLKYVQGVVQGQRVYLVTNLLGESQTLVQPQMVWTLGRNRDAALPLRDRAMSRRHAVILYVPNVGFHLIDLNSMNGSFINGSRIQQRQLLKDGDRVRVGSIDFTFFSSRSIRSIEPIHPEVLARFTASESRMEGFIDYSALEEPEILFKTTKR